MSDAIAKDCDGREIRVGDRVRPVDGWYPWTVTALLPGAARLRAADGINHVCEDRAGNFVIVDPIKNVPDPAGSADVANREGAEAAPEKQAARSAAIGTVCAECKAAGCALERLENDLLCAYCVHRVSDTGASVVGPHENWNKPSVVGAIAVTPVEDIEGDVFERCNWSEP